MSRHHVIIQVCCLSIIIVGNLLGTLRATVPTPHTTIDRQAPGVHWRLFVQLGFLCLLSARLKNQICTGCRADVSPSVRGPSAVRFVLISRKLSKIDSDVVEAKILKPRTINIRPEQKLRYAVRLTV